MVEKISTEDLNLKEDTPAVKDRRSAVATHPRAKILYLIIMSLIIITVLYFTFGGKKTASTNKVTTQTIKAPEQKTQEELDKLAEKATPIPTDETSKYLLPPKAPTMPPLIAPGDLPKPPAILPPVAPLSTPAPTPMLPPSRSITRSGDRTTQMLVIRGSGSIPNTDGIVVNPGMQNENSPLQRSGNQILPTYMGKTNYMVSQGKMIDAILEPPISTDLQGMIRAIVSRDVYADSGTLVLIPKGSRLIGTFASTKGASQTRVDIAWQRLILPWGVDIAIASPGTDPLGKAGIPGTVNTKIMNLLSVAFLKSSIEIAAGYLVGRLTGNGEASKTTTKTNPVSGTTTVTTDPATAAYQKAINGLASDTEGLIDQYKDATPSIDIPQGAKVKVFVNRDLIFPKAAFDLVENVNN